MLHALERKALRWLRMAASAAKDTKAGSTGWAGSPLSGIAHSQLASHPIFLAPDAPFVAPGEHEFLTLVAYCQREASAPTSPDPVLELAAFVAGRLLVAGVRLPPPISSELPDRVKSQLRPALPAPAAASDGDGRAGTVRARVITLLERQGTASRDELLALGMTRQYLSLLVRTGVIARTGKLFHRAWGESVPS